MTEKHYGGSSSFAVKDNSSNQKIIPNKENVKSDKTNAKQDKVTDNNLDSNKEPSA